MFYGKTHNHQWYGCFKQKKDPRIKLQQQGHSLTGSLMGTSVHEALQDVIHVVNFMKIRSFNTGIFTILWRGYEWPWRSFVSQRLTGYLTAKSLQRWGHLFPPQKHEHSKSADLFCDEKGLSVLCDRGQYVRKIKTFILCLQCKGDILTRSEKVTAFLKNLIA